eukprot:TRINITY_DN3269_c0_g1_i1.p2 TRINITY_DN3269_c0_g1~~TRINITY_DN3269_c0_g1_i1.p2  ORF type:complete len:83 (+),score=24.94 TRINITY_DN3269_c0_g1_i1:349-597(+)
MAESPADMGKLLITGCHGPKAKRVVQDFLNLTSDIQTVAIASCYVEVFFVGATDIWPVNKYIRIYKDLLNGRSSETAKAHRG